MKSPGSSLSIAICALLVLVSNTRDSFGQLSAKQLVWSATEEYGPEYKDVELAVEQFKKKNFDIARAQLAKAAEQHKQLAPADTMMGMLFLSVGNIASAKKSLDQSIVRSPEDAEAYILLGDIWLRQNELSVAQLAYDRANSLLDSEVKGFRPTNLKKRILGGLASVSEGRAQYAKAFQHLKAWQELDPKNPTCAGSLGRVSFYLQKFDQARDYFRQLRELDNSAPTAEIAMAGLFSDLGNKDEARKEMLAAVEKDGDDIRSRITISEWAINVGEYELAKTNLAAALKLDPNSATAQLLSARLARQQGDLKGAEEILKKAILKYPNHFSIANELARTLAESDDKAVQRTGLDYARRNFQLYGKQKTRVGTEAQFTFAWLLFKNGRNDAAVAALSQLASGTSIGNENAYYAAMIYDGANKKPVALSAVQAALKGENQFPNRDNARQLLTRLENELKKPVSKKN